MAHNNAPAMIPYTGYNDIAIDPPTGNWTSPAVVSEEYPVIAVWTVDGYMDADGTIY